MTIGVLVTSGIILYGVLSLVTVGLIGMKED